MSNGERASELLGSVPSVLLHSGNIASWSKLRRKGVLTPTDELVSTIEASFTSWLGRQSDDTSGQNEVIVRNAGLCQRVDEATASNHIFSLKIFLCSWSPQLVRDAVHTSFEELGLSKVDTIIFAFPSSLPDSELSLDQVIPIWKEVELLIQEGVARVAGVVDFNKNKLEELYNEADMKPMVNQVNIADCCTIPEDLLAFSKQHNIKLTTHNDDRDILPQSQLTSTLSATLEGHGIEHTSWSPLWVARYSSIIKLRGIIAHKGYLLRLDTGKP